jgi:O-antigen/teichoic acid export membrane protein/SAM-dependent methyltransferase
MREGVVNYSGTLASLLLGLVLVPVMLDGLGREAYGVWVAAAAVSIVVGSLDLGLGSLVMREVAASDGAHEDGEAALVVRAAGSAYVLFGALGGVAVALVGQGLSAALDLSPRVMDDARLAFALSGIGVLGDQLLLFAGGVLGGLRRFGTVNGLTIALVAGRFAGIVGLLSAGGGLVPVMAWQAVTSLLMAATSLTILSRAAPAFHLHLRARPNLRALRTRAGFGIGSVLATLASAVSWQVAPLLVGIVVGSPALALYQVSQKIPIAVSGISNRMSTVLFPAASRYERSGDVAASADLVTTGTRWIAIVIVPLAALLWPLAPAILERWVDDTSAASTTTFRLALVAIVADGLGISALQVLWGRAAMAVIVRILGAAAALNIAVSLVLLFDVGRVGAAWGLAASTIVGATALSIAATRRLGMSTRVLAVTTTRGLVRPALACLGTSYGLTRLIAPSGWLEIAVVAFAAGAAYGVVLAGHGARPEEKAMARQARIAVGRALRSPYYLLLELRRAARDSAPSADAAYDADFRSGEDPWGYVATSREQSRFRVALDHLRREAPAGGFDRALEVGCAEGIFTALLAEHARSVLAVDNSGIALERAARRCSGIANVDVARWDLRHDPIPGQFSLVVVMDVLDCFYRPSDLRSALAKVVASVEPGGHLLFSTKLQNETIEHAPWTRWLVRGASALTAYVARGPDLELVASERSEQHVVSILRRPISA